MLDTQTANVELAAIAAQQGNDGGVGTAHGGGNHAALGNGGAPHDSDRGDLYGATGGVDGSTGAQGSRGTSALCGPHQLLQARANSKRTYTAMLRKVRKAITDRVPAD